MPVKINGSTSGSVTLAAPATGTDVTLTLPGSTGTVPLLAGSNTWTGTQNFTGATVTGSGLDLISSSTFSAVGSVSINNCFTSTYENYRVLLQAYHSAGPVALGLRWRAGGSDQTLSGYYDAQAGWRTNNTASNYAAAADTRAHIGYIASSVRLSASFDVIVAQGTNDVTMNGVSNHYDTGSNYQSNILGNRRTSAAAADGFTIFPASGTITGTLRVYGYRN